MFGIPTHTWILYFSIQFLHINIYLHICTSRKYNNIYIINSYLYNIIYIHKRRLRRVYVRKTLGIFYDIFLSYTRVWYMFNMIIICVYIVYYYIEVGYFNILLLYYSHLQPSSASPCARDTATPPPPSSAFPSRNFGWPFFRRYFCSRSRI